MNFHNNKHQKILLPYQKLDVTFFEFNDMRMSSEMTSTAFLLWDMFPEDKRLRTSSKHQSSALLRIHQHKSIATKKMGSDTVTDMQKGWWYKHYSLRPKI